MAMGGHDFSATTADNYRVFAAEAAGRSPLYQRLALAVAGDARVLGFLDTLPTAKRQPNLLFAAARYLLGEPPDLAALHALLSDQEDELAEFMLARRTQTNEPRGAPRCCPPSRCCRSRWRWSRSAPAPG